MLDLFDAANCWISTGKWRTWLDPEDFLILKRITSSHSAWLQFWSNCLIGEIPYHIAANIRSMFISELLIDNFEAVCAAVSLPLISTSRNADPFAIPIDFVYYPIHELEPPISSKMIEDVKSICEPEESVCDSVASPPSTFKYLTQLVGNNSLFSKPSLSRKPLNYSAYEKVLHDLKNYSVHSQAFLTKVSKAQAPDYYTIIKTPMDLGTVAKKLKALQYPSKKEFSDDLYLICLKLDSHPENVYRKHGAAMKKRTTELLKRIPDDTNLDGYSEAEDDDLIVPESTPDSRRQSTPSLADPDSRATIGQKSLQDQQQPDQYRLEGSLTPEIISAEAQLEPPFVQKYFDLTFKTRAIIQKSRISRRHKSFPDRKAIITCARDFQVSLVGQDLYNKRSTFSQSMKLNEFGALIKDDIYERSPLTKIDGFNVIVGEAINDDIGITEFYIPELFCNHAIIPPILEDPVYIIGDYVISPADLFKSQVPSHISKLLPSISDFTSSRADPSSRIYSMVHANISSLSQIKEYHSRIVAKESKSAEGRLQISAIPTMNTLVAPITTSLPMSDESAALILRQNIALMLSHTGFDATQETAIAALLDIAISYFLTLGKTIKSYTDIHSQTLSQTIILHKALLQNNIPSIASLEFYIRHDIQQFGAKLSDLSYKLMTAYHDIDLMPESEDIHLEQHVDSVISGALFEEYGVDLLGLKDIAGLGVSSIPHELWNRKARVPTRARVRRRGVIEAQTDVQQVDLSFKLAIDSWDAVVPSQHIHLLRDFFARRNHDMVEDDFKPKTKLARSKVQLKTAQLGRKRVAISKEVEEAKTKKKAKIIAASAADPSRSSKEAKKLDKQRAKEEKRRLKVKKEY